MNQSITFSDVQLSLERVAPSRWQESWDNSGHLIGDPQSAVSGILVCLDLSDAVLDEAQALECNLIVSHHPLFLKGLKRLTGGDRESRFALRMAGEGIGLISVHTSYDAAPGGVSFQLGEALGVRDMRPLEGRESGKVKLVTFVPAEHLETVSRALFDAGAGIIGDYSYCSFRHPGVGTFQPSLSSDPYVGLPGEYSEVPEVRLETVIEREHVARVVRALRNSHPYEEMTYDVVPLLNHSAFAGLGVIGELEHAESESDFASRVREVLGCAALRHSVFTGRTVRRVALCGGSGLSLLSDALRNRADAFVTADAKYHDFQGIDGRLLLIDAGHAETERVALPRLADHLMECFSRIPVHIAKREPTVIHYL